MRVICISEGNQTNQRPVKKGDHYTVVKIVEGWQVWSEDVNAEFYLIKEMGSLCVYHSKLFALLDNDDNEESINESCYLSHTLNLMD